MNRSFLVWLLPCLFLSCQNNSRQPGNSKESGKASYLKFQPATLIDQEGTEGPALTLLIPEGWKLEGRVIWTTSNAGFPATGHMQVTDPAGACKFEYFPLLSFHYTQNPMSLQLTPAGTYYGGHLVVTSVSGTTATLKNYILKFFRKDIKDLQIVEEKVLQPEKKEAISSNIYARYEPALLHIAYTENGMQYEEQIFATRSITESPSMDFKEWYITNCYGFRAPKGKLEENRKLFQTMLNSIQIDKNWYNTYVQVSQALIAQGYKNIAAAGQVSRIISQTNDQISQSISDSYWSTQQSNAKIYDNYSEYQRGIDTYTDPGSNETYKLPSGYGHAWKNAQGEYIVSDDANFNPNDAEKHSWSQLELKQ